MKMVFGVLSLLIVLAIVGSLAKTQLRAFGVGSPSATRLQSAASAAGVEASTPDIRDGATRAIPGGMPGAVAAGAGATELTVPQQSRNLQQQIRDDTARALQQGVERNERANP